MKRIQQSQLGFTLTEGLVAGVVFTIAIAGVFASIGSFEKPHQESVEKVEAARLGQKILQQLRAKVDQRLWDDSNGPLVPGNTYNDSVVIGSRTYEIEYKVVQDGLSSARRVDLEITWAD